MIPGNRTAQTGAEETLQRFVVRMQGWFRDQMERLGYGPKTFAYQTGEDGLLQRSITSTWRSPIPTSIATTSGSGTRC